jgi:hypothetical protein
VFYIDQMLYTEALNHTYADLLLSGVLLPPSFSLFPDMHFMYHPLIDKCVGWEDIEDAKVKRMINGRSNGTETVLTVAVCHP